MNDTGAKLYMGRTTWQRKLSRGSVAQHKTVGREMFMRGGRFLKKKGELRSKTKAV